MRAPDPNTREGVAVVKLDVKRSMTLAQHRHHCRCSNWDASTSGQPENAIRCTILAVLFFQPFRHKSWAHPPALAPFGNRDSGWPASAQMGGVR